MRPADFIEAKKRGLEHRAGEIADWIRAFMAGEVSDAQMAAWMMAVVWRGMSPSETAALTEAMAASGSRLDLSALPGPHVDKHSTGGVGDKATLLVVPLLAALGLPVVKLSGHGLGHTGGTLDKLESIPGFRTALEPSEAVAQARRIGLVVAGHSASLAPADARMYALRDVTATVDSLPLITASILSKKMAGGADAVVVDVKVGAGAFLPGEAEARRLAESLVATGARLGLAVRCVLTRMEEPLGRTVGNAVEVREAVEALRGQAEPGLRACAEALAAEALVMAGRAADPEEARARVAEVWRRGEALERFARMVEAQGGDPRVVDQPERLELAPVQAELAAPADGWLERLDARRVGEAVMALGAGRRHEGERVDHGVGAEVLAKVGERVEAGQPLLRLRARDREAAGEALRHIAAGVRIAAEPVGSPDWVLSIVRNPAKELE
ncbi:MAG: thymidine phosphorylase [Firmicutes bacterium]|nr:thymidine phosphorylase [Bacillota bacterium]